MSEQDITSLSYEEMVEDALRSVLRKALQVTASQGLPGAHHFFVTFDTTNPGVVIADVLRAMHPSEMTIVLQHQFWDLEVKEEYFEITLSFNSVNQHLHVPFAAVTAFADPHAKFGLQFQIALDQEPYSDMNEYDPDGFEQNELDDSSNNSNTGSTAINSPTKTKVINKKLADVENSKKTLDTRGDKKDSDNVVTLDTFRKK